MNIVLNRIDERLIHGQILASWAKKLQVHQILVIDDQLANDQFAEAVLTMALPANISLKIFDINKGIIYIQDHADETSPNTILLVKSPEVIKRLWDLNYHPDSLNIGGMSAGPARKHLCRSLYATEKEISIFQELENNGTEVYIQVVYGENKIYFRDLI
ncbi:MAG: PTS sugar transporter subunit IIB [Lachnospiraceae bacterium]|jgi:mannose/fructose/N-acetylgalactosamine-specific phosphotransferase system component IIB|nr:PTS sugar transporter subunit IIB [Lachnospiraceae bacterium]